MGCLVNPVNPHGIENDTPMTTNWKLTIDSNVKTVIDMHVGFNINLDLNRKSVI